MKSNLPYEIYEVNSRQEIAPATFLFTFQQNIKFSPGQFVQVMLDHFGEATFAPCSLQNQKNLELCIRGCGNVTKQLIKLLPGDQVKIRGPFGKGWPIHNLIGKNILIIAGGIGMVPFRSLLHELLRYRKEFRKVNIVAGFKTNHHLIFEEDLHQLKEKLDVEVVVEHLHGKFWGKKGIITDALQDIKVDKNTIALICGPEIMFDHCIAKLEKKGLPEKNIFLSFERRMECGFGICQHCSIGKYLVCEDGPVFRYDIIKEELGR